MKIAGIIAEYNPFHNGHLYHLNQTRKLTGADYIIVVMSGDFTQRGIPAIIDKHARAKMALEAGADLVLELPTFYATSSAEYFAYGAVSILEQLGCVDFLCFGSESTNMDFLSNVAQLLVEEPVSYTDNLKNLLKQGFSYPDARAKALANILTNMPTDASRILSSSNNILGIEYLKALLRLNSSITPVALLRHGNDYLSEELSDVYSSALAIRKYIQTNASFSALAKQLPASTYHILEDEFGQTGPLFTNDFSSMLHYRLLCEQENGYFGYLDITEDLSDKIKKNLNTFESFEQFCMELKSKDMTYTRINRCLTHILLDMKKDTLDLNFTEHPAYARILGFRKESRELLSIIKESAKLSMISKPADALGVLDKKNASAFAKALWNLDIKAAHIYNAVVNEKFHVHLPNEYTRQFIKLA